jgi:hypothetical protein
MLKYEIIISIVYVAEMLSSLYQNIILLNVCRVPAYFFLGFVFMVHN